MGAIMRQTGPVSNGKNSQRLTTEIDECIKNGYGTTDPFVEHEIKRLGDLHNSMNSTRAFQIEVEDTNTLASAPKTKS